MIEEVICSHCGKKYKNKHSLDGHLFRVFGPRVIEYKADFKTAKEMNEQGLTVKEITQKLKVSKTTIYKLFKENKYVPLKVAAKHDRKAYEKEYRSKPENKLRASLYNKKKYRENPEKKREDTKKWRENNPEKIKQYQEDNREKENAKHKIYDAEHKEEKRIYMRDYYQENREKHLARMDAYFKTPQGKQIRKAMGANRKNIPWCSKLTKELVRQVYENNPELICPLCFELINEGEDSLEHFIPLNRHKEFPGKDLNALDNLDIAHLSCNCSKRDATLEEWFNDHPQYVVKGLNLGYMRLKKEGEKACC